MWKFARYFTKLSGADIKLPGVMAQLRWGAPILL